MNLLIAGCSFRSTPLALRERISLDENACRCAVEAIAAKFDCEAAILSTCNRTELYLAEPSSGAALDPAAVAGFLADYQKVPAAELSSHLYFHHDGQAVRHLFRVATGLDSMVLGESQIAGQVRKAYDIACTHLAAGPWLHALFQQAARVVRRVRQETGLHAGHVSVASVAVDYIRQVFAHFDDKSVLLIGAGKMGERTLRSVMVLGPREILVANRSPEKADSLAATCQGQTVPWDRLDDALVRADIILSSTGSPEPIVSRERYQHILPGRAGRTLIIIDIAVPRDFDPRIHDGDQTCLFNIDDLKRLQEQTLVERRRHIADAEAIVNDQVQRFLQDSDRRRHGRLIAQLTDDFEAKRQAVMAQLLSRLNGRLSDEDRSYIEGAFRLLQNQFLHGPISALAEESQEPGRLSLLDALRKLFGLRESDQNA
jgi:glutamyl-tRNA reductase